MMTTHKIGAYIVHADAGWNNGNSATGIALAIHIANERGMTTDHVVHALGKTCEHC